MTKHTSESFRGKWHNAEPSWTTSAAMLPSLANGALKIVLGITVGLYVLNQQHMLPRGLSSIVSKALFWPTLPITAVKRIGAWYTTIDDTVILGGAPFGFLKIPEELYREYGVRGVINFCEEYKGPTSKYKELGIDQLYLPTTDHFEPSEEDLVSAVQFIRKHKALGNRVYVHCRAGHGRSAAAIFMWMLSKDPIVDLKVVNQEMCALRNVRPTLWRQPNIGRLHSRMLRTGVLSAEPKGEPPGSSNPTTTNTNENEFVTRLGAAILEDMSDSNSEDEF